MDRNILKENIQHGNSMLPLMVYKNYREDFHNESILYCHWHNELEFLFVTEGKATFQVEADYYEVNTNEAIFINSEEIHAGFSLDNSSCIFYAVVFDSELLCSSTPDALQSKYIDPLINRQYLLPVHVKGNSEWEKGVIKKLQDIVNICTNKPKGYELSAKAFLYLILSDIIANTDLDTSLKENSTNNNKAANLKLILNYIHENFDRNISVQDLAALVNLSEGHLHRFFKKMTRKTIVDYINHYRINRASSLLKSGDEKISKIAMDVGFDNISYFNSVFKQYMKCTPKEHRRQS